MTDDVMADRALGSGPRRTAAGLLAAGLLTVGLAGCGGTTRATGTQTVASGPATPHISQSLKAREVAIHRRVEAALHQKDTQRYGGIPKDLKDRQAAPRDQILTSRIGRPANPIQGVAVRVTLPSGAHALMTLVGPDVPDRDQGSFRAHTDATWALTFADVHGRIPLGSRRFSITDEQGRTLTPRLTTRAGARAPAVVPEGAPFTLELHARTSIGSGEVRYQPVGGKLAVEWNFDAETD